MALTFPDGDQMVTVREPLPKDALIKHLRRATFLHLHQRTFGGKAGHYWGLVVKESTTICEREPERCVIVPLTTPSPHQGERQR